MSGDVQPRKRKDKRRKKDELGVDEPRGTAALFGEGDVLMHSHHDHGTGGHWCAKLIFFSLLSVLVTLIVLIILENRGLTELEANAVESRYSGVLDGWIEDTPDDDHHDEHTLDLKHHSYEDIHDDGDDDNQHDIESEHDEDNHNEEEFSDENDDSADDDEDDGANDDDDDEADDDDNGGDDDIDDDDKYDIDYRDKYDSDDKSIEEDDDDDEADERMEYKKYTYEEQAEDDDDDDNDEGDDNDENDEDYDSQEEQGDEDSKEDTKDYNEQDDNIDNNSNELQGDDDSDISAEQRKNEHDDKQNDDTDDMENEDAEDEEDDSDDQEVERIEREVVDEEEQAISFENQDVESDENYKEEDNDEDEKTLEADDIIEPPIVEQITVPSGKPFVELEDEPSSEKPTDTLAEEEEYEKRQEQIRLEKEESSSQKDGGNNVEDEWPGEPSDQYWRQQLDIAEQEIRQGEFASANARLSAAALAGSGRARWLAALSVDNEAEQRRDNKLLTRAIYAYLQLLKISERLSDVKLIEVTTRALNRIQFRGNYLSAEPVYRILIRRFPNEVSYRNNLTVSFLMANRADLAADVLKETLKLWPNDRVALAHYGFVLKTHYNKLEESVTMFRKALENDTGPACEPRFYYHLGDALLLLGRFEEAHEVHKRGAEHGHFLSPAQRSLYNVDTLKSRPWWRVEETPYIKLAKSLERSWKEILKEGEAARALYEKEKEGLKEKGEWSQLDIFVRGQEIPGRCKRAPVTCSLVKTEPAAANCRRGQIKFSLMEPGTHVRPHVGPTNCRLRMHLGLSNTKDTYIRVDQETRQWQLGKVLLFDDSFEHEVWHNGTGGRLVLIVDVWHPDLSAAERRQLPAI